MARQRGRAARHGRHTLMRLKFNAWFALAKPIDATQTNMHIPNGRRVSRAARASEWRIARCIMMRLLLSGDRTRIYGISLTQDETTNRV